MDYVAYKLQGLLFTVPGEARKSAFWTPAFCYFITWQAGTKTDRQTDRQTDTQMVREMSHELLSRGHGLRVFQGDKTNRLYLGSVNPPHLGFS